MTLLNETKLCFYNSGHTPKDIVYIGSQYTGHRCSWEEFQLLADRFYFPNGDEPKVLDDLVIVFTDDSMMWRALCNGHEYWEYSPKFVMPIETKEIDSLFGDDYPGNPINFQSFDKIERSN